MTQSLAHLASRALIRLEGPDWRSFLQGLITQDVARAADGALAYGALLTPQGRLLHDFFFWEDGAGVLIDVAAFWRDELMSKLLRHRLRAKVEIAADAGQLFAAWGSASAPDHEGWRADPRLAELGFRAILDPVASCGGEPEYEAHRLAVGASDPAHDARESDYPIELNLDALHGLDFKKGCFIGQETTSRMHRRGLVKTRAIPIVFEGRAPAFGSEVLAGDRRAGEVRSGREGRALALLRMDRAIGAPLTAEGRSIRLAPPQWLCDLFQVVDEEAPQSAGTL